jgi:anti-sigma factor RsiW
MDPTDSITEEDLHAYLDGELPAGRAAAIESYLDRHPDEVRRLNAYRADGAAMARIFSYAGRTSRPQSGSRQLLLRVAAATALLAIGSAAGWVARDHLSPSTDPLVQKAAAAHAMLASTSESPSSLPLGDVAGLEAAISHELAARVRVLDLKDLGYHLVAARTLLPPNARAVQLVYGSAGKPISIYLEARPGARETPFRDERRGSIATVAWEDDDLACAISGEVDPETLSGDVFTRHSTLDMQMTPEDRPRAPPNVELARPP